MTNKQLLTRVKNLIPKVQSPEQMYSLTILANMYIDRPTKDNKETLEIYCDLIESSIELDILEENTKKCVK